MDRTLAPRRLLSATMEGVTAFDAATGRVLWHTPLTWNLGNGPIRVAQEESVVVVAYYREVKALDVDSGTVRSSFELPFNVKTVLARGGLLMLSGESGVACLRQGALVWQAVTERKWSGAGRTRVTDARGNLIHEFAGVVASEESALVFEGEVAQAVNRG